MTYGRLEADAAEPYVDTRTGYDDGSFARARDEGLREARNAPARVELLSDVTGRKFRVVCSRCHLPLIWYHAREQAQANADAHLAFMHGNEFPVGEWVPPRLRPGEWRVESRTRPGVFYRVTQGIDGARVCTCRGWDRYANCWHVHEEPAKGVA